MRNNELGGMAASNDIQYMEAILSMERVTDDMYIAFSPDFMTV
jgi:hypothetical protein